MKQEIKSKRVRAIIDELKDQYMEADALAVEVRIE